MYLKALEIQGFKSFPDKTTLPFDKDITAVVGPNGSGKSNISDAIRWVVGEQSSKMLRGGKMEDVIFGGTEKRKQTSFAQVSLIMDNTNRIFNMDESEVMVTRRYYRSGESEYYINRHAVRLRDVNELFMDTGLGKEGYALIGQGKIDEILSVKSGQRREVFEEAAGIAKYRHRKEESERKLARTEENLVRIQDKIAELELQVEPLRAQSETAKKFLILRDHLRELEISLWLEQISVISANKLKLDSDFSLAQSQRDQIAEAVTTLYQKVEEFSTKMREKDQESDIIRTDLHKAEGVTLELENEITVLRNNISNNQTNAERLRDSLAQQQGREQALRDQATAQQLRLDEIATTRGTLATAQTEKQHQADTLYTQAGTLSRELEQLQQRQSLEGVSVSEARALLSALSSSAQEIFDQDSQLRDEVATLVQKIQEEQASLTATKAEQATAQEGRDSAQNMVSGFELRMSTRREKLDKSKSALQTLEVEHRTASGRLKMLTDMENALEGYSNAVKVVMREANEGRMPNIHGPVAGLLTVPNELTIAIETALGGAMQNIVVSTPQDGKTVIEYLKRRNAGRATILPLSTMRPGSLSQKESLKKVPGFVGIASELIGFDPTYTPIFSNLLGRVAVIETLDHAIACAAQFNHQFRIVTLDGQVLNQGGSMTGGSANRSAGILSRKDERDKLQATTEQQLAILQSAQKEVEELGRVVSSDQHELELARGELRACEDALLRWEGAENQHLRLISDLTAQQSQRQLSLAQLQGRADKIERDTAEAREKIASLDLSVSLLSEQTEQSQKNRETLAHKQATLAEEIASFTAQLSAIDAEERAVSDSLANLVALLADLTGDREENSSLLDNYSQENQEFDQKIAQKQTLILTQTNLCDTLRLSLADKAQEKLALEGERNEADRNSREKNTELLDLERQVTALDQKKVTVALEEKQILDKLWDTYELSHDGAQALKIEIESVPRALREISEQKREIADLGTINIGAIDEFERINERYTYLSTQRDDVRGAMNQLEEIIADLVREMQTIFKTEFDKINTAFGEIFTQLFGGGKAKVVLEDENDVLGSGIEIHAQPPGKALKVISLLSGGEKAFVAIALYFAILRIRPTPFVVMDEIEAALDDSNIERFVKYLRTISDKTQFIVITHRRGTMEAADVLYGITMQERGVSRMLRLSLNEVERELGILE